MFSTETIKPTSPAALGKSPVCTAVSKCTLRDSCCYLFFCVCTVWFFFFQSCARYIAQTSRVFIFFVFFRSLKEGTYTLHRQGWLCGRPGMTNKPLLPSLKQGVRRFFFSTRQGFFTHQASNARSIFFVVILACSAKFIHLFVKRLFSRCTFCHFFFQLNLLRRTFPWNR